MLTYMITGAGENDVLVERLRMAIEEGVDWIQIRRKGAAARDVEDFVRRVLAALPRARGDLFVNDRLDVALALGAGGVHLPDAGIPVARARALVPPGFRIGVSVHGVERAVEAEAEGAEFLVFGPVFATTSKPGRPGVGLAALRDVAERVRIPVLAIGGISESRVDRVWRAGAAGVAGISVFEDRERRRRLLERARAISREMRT